MCCGIIRDLATAFIPKNFAAKGTQIHFLPMKKRVLDARGLDAIMVAALIQLISYSYTAAHTNVRFLF